MLSFSANRIFLVGYMGSGKSTIGGLLAAELDFLFLDTDRIIEQLLGCSIPQIFKEKGESVFRQKEQEVTNFLCDLDRVVIATGGGLPCFNDNMDKLLAAGITIYLDCCQETLATRIANEKGQRPLHDSNLKHDNLLRQIKTKLAMRLPIYQAAHLCLQNETAPELLVSDLLAKIRGEY